MIGSTTPLAERPDWHPVHRANALLRRALLSSGATSPENFAALAEAARLQQIDDAISRLVDGLAGVTYPRPLAARLSALSAWEAPDTPVMGPLADTHGGEDAESRDPGATALPADAENAMQALFGVAPRAQLQTLMRDFHRRQRQASLLVICSLAAAFVLTLGGLLVLFSITEPAPAEIDDQASPHATSIAWKKTGAPPARLEHISVEANHTEKGAPLLIRAQADAGTPGFGQATPDAQVILAAPHRPLALSPLLPQGYARYLLLRGLPAEAKLSAGRQTGPGAWMVKDEQVADLTLTVGETASGDYPVDVYLLDAGNAPQARRRLVLRVEPAPRPYTAGFDMGWAAALLDVAFTAPATADPVPPAEPSVLLERARRLLDEGDIAAARLLLRHLADQGEGEAAYELARTYDQAEAIDGDPVRARAWYERASQDGNLKAAERLKILAGLSGTPSD